MQGRGARSTHQEVTVPRSRAPPAPAPCVPHLPSPTFCLRFSFLLSSVACSIFSFHKLKK